MYPTELINYWERESRNDISTKSSHVAVMHMNAVVRLDGLLFERLGQTRVSNRPDISVHWFAFPRWSVGARK